MATISTTTGTRPSAVDALLGGGAAAPVEQAPAERTDTDRSTGARADRDTVTIESSADRAEVDRTRAALGLDANVRTAPMFGASTRSSGGSELSGIISAEAARTVPNVAGKNLGPVKSARDPAPERLASPATFDAKYYLAQNPDLGAAGITTDAQAKQHWLQYGLDEGRAGSATFDPKAYLGRYGDLRAAFGSDYRAAAQHYLDYGIGEGRNAGPVRAPGGGPAPDSALSLANPNLQIFDPQNRSLGTIIDPAHPSAWMVKQWHTGAVITPQSTGVRSDPQLGTAQHAYATASSALAIYDDPTHPGNPVYELATAGGENTAYGARNLFLQRELSPPVAVRDGTKIDLDYRVPYAQIQKSGDFDATNVGQVHLGLIFHNPKTGQTMFLQKELYESNGNGDGAHIDGDPNDPNDRGTHAPLFASSGRPGDDLRTPVSEWTHLSVDVRAEVAKALSAGYGTAGGGTYRLPPGDPSDWQLTAVYFGTETAGTAVLTTQVKNMGLTP